MLKKLALAALLAAPALASAGPYLVMGAASGSADLADLEATFAGPVTSDDSFTRAVVGVGFNLNPNLSVEGLYLTETEATVKQPGREDTLKDSGLQFSLIGLAPIAPQLSLFGKLSANYMRVEWESAPAALSDSDSNFHVGFGAGLQLQASDQVGVRLGVERIQLRDAINGSGDSDEDQASLAVQFSF